MKHIDTSEFAEHAAQYLFGGRALAVEHEGRTLGYYLPVAVVPDAARQHAVEQLGRAVERLLEALALIGAAKPAKDMRHDTSVLGTSTNRKQIDLPTVRSAKPCIEIRAGTCVCSTRRWRYCLCWG